MWNADLKAKWGSHSGMTDEISDSTGSLACIWVRHKYKKQPLYIQLSWVTQGKPSGKKQSTGNIKITESISCTYSLWLQT